MTRERLTVEAAVEQELYSLGEAIGNCLELNDEFIASSCGGAVSELLLLVDESDREFVLQGSIGEGYDGGYCNVPGDCIGFPVGEIEVQFEGKPEEYFADVDDWTISGDCAYTTMVSAIFEIDLEQLREAVADWLLQKHDSLIGSISHATMRAEDLIPCFSSELERLAKQAAPHLGAVDPDHMKIVNECNALTEDDYNSEDVETIERISWLLNEDLFNALDSFAPSGLYFGANEGDGSDYGYWVQL